MPEQPVLLVELERDLGAPPLGWPSELAGRGVVVFEDDLGRAAVERSAARAIYAEHREQQEAAARRRAEIERRVIEADERFRDSLPAGIPAGAVPEGVTPGMLLMLSDPMQGPRRRSVLEDALANDGTVYHPIREES